MTKYVSISLPVDIKYESTHKYSIDKFVNKILNIYRYYFYCFWYKMHSIYEKNSYEN